jgi:hypothetical protein
VRAWPNQSGIKHALRLLHLMAWRANIYRWRWCAVHGGTDLAFIHSEIRSDSRWWRLTSQQGSDVTIQGRIGGEEGEGGS